MLLEYTLLVAVSVVMPPVVLKIRRLSAAGLLLKMTLTRRLPLAKSVESTSVTTAFGAPELGTPAAALVVTSSAR